MSALLQFSRHEARQTLTLTLKRSHGNCSIANNWEWGHRLLDCGALRTSCAVILPCWCFFFSTSEDKTVYGFSAADVF